MLKMEVVVLMGTERDLMLDSIEKRVVARLVDSSFEAQVGGVWNRGNHAALQTREHLLGSRTGSVWMGVGRMLMEMAASDGWSESLIQAESR
jgi:hypothetical protein